MLTAQVKDDIQELIAQNIDDWKKDCDNYGLFDENDDDLNGLELTISTNSEGDQFAYQTGDNSFTGSCYSHPHWGVTSVNPDSTVEELTDEIISQLEELLGQQIEE